MVVLQIEAEVRAQIERWEAQQQRPFLVQGMRFVDYIREQWDDYHRNKENEKEERVSDVTPHEFILLKATCFLLFFFLYFVVSRTARRRRRWSVN